jgi:hypothetical protein
MESLGRNDPLRLYPSPVADEASCRRPFPATFLTHREANPDLKGNIRDYATINELIS